MNINFQGIMLVIAVLIGLLLGLAVSYVWMQRRLKQQDAALQAHRQQLQDLEEEYATRLQTTTQQLRDAYDVELANTIAHYQDQLADKTIELQQTYDTRLQVLQQGVSAAMAEQTASKPEPQADPELVKAEVARLKQQYEVRLKEATQKLQRAYEQQLAQHTQKARADLQAEFEQQLALKTEEYEAQFAARKAELEEDFAQRQESLSQNQAFVSGDGDVTPSEIMGTGDETTVTMPPSARPVVPATVPSPSLPVVTEADISDRINAATAQVRQEYEQQLAAKLAEQEQQLATRLQELEDKYRDRQAAIAPPPGDSELMTDEPASESSHEEVVELESMEERSSEAISEDDFDPLDLSDISQLT